MTNLERHTGQENSISYYGWTVTAMAFLANLAGYGVVFAFGVFLKPLAEEFTWSRSLTTGAFTFYAILHNVLAVFSGQIVDKFGPRAIAITAGLFIGLGTLMMMFINSIWQLYIFYGVFLAIGISCNYAPLMSTVSRWFHQKRGLAIGITAGGVGAASLIFSPLSAWLITVYGWRTAYLTLGVACWLIFIPIVLLMKAAPAAQGIDEGNQKASAQLTGLSFKEACRTFTLWAFCLAFLFGSFAEWAIMINIVPLTTDRGFSLVEASMVAAVISLGSFTGRIAGGFLSDRLGRKKVFTMALFIQMLTLLLLFSSQQLWILLLFAILFGLSMGGWTGIVAAFPADYFGFRATGTILGFAVLVASIGISTGPLVGSYFYDTMHSYDNMVLICILTTIIAIIFACLIRPVRK